MDLVTAIRYALECAQDDALGECDHWLLVAADLLKETCRA